ncbi:lmo0937 family membrane protein [Clostridium sp.]|jgi:uncharacterized membrane protein|uniref:lmo0937 family membrane protein n=1 Tax=Clostridium sp. TaxID=1506 RepID=UPI003EF00574
MKLLRWVGGIIIFFWALGLIFKIGGIMIHILLLMAAIVFIVDLSLERWRGKRRIP